MSGKQSYSVASFLRSFPLFTTILSSLRDRDPEHWGSVTSPRERRYVASPLKPRPSRNGGSPRVQSPTKKGTTKAKAKKRRDMQKASRKANRRRP